MDMKRHVDCRLVSTVLGPDAPLGEPSRSMHDKGCDTYSTESVKIHQFKQAVCIWVRQID